MTVLTGLVPIMASVLRGDDPEDGLAFTSLFMMAVSGFLGFVGLAGGSTARRLLRLGREPAYAELSFRGRTGLIMRALATSAGEGAAGGTAIGVVLYPVLDLASAVLMGLASVGAGLVVGLRRWAEFPQADDDGPRTPSASLRGDLRLNYLTVAVSGLLAMTFIMLLYTLVIPEALMIDGAVDWETVGGMLTVGAWIGAMLGLGLGTGLQSAGATYLATIVLLRIRRRLPSA
ncbi:hypothetical protein [Actinomadura sp. NPDC048394]|uniref:hypothetical protein n=1 Tax=Actinomadura sp. NPDC048394 TaxID=3158223 RepID=UPI0033D114F1